MENLMGVEKEYSLGDAGRCLHSYDDKLMVTFVFMAAWDERGKHSDVLIGVDRCRSVSIFIQDSFDQ